MKNIICWGLPIAAFVGLLCGLWTKFDFPIYMALLAVFIFVWIVLWIINTMKTRKTERENKEKIEQWLKEAEEATSADAEAVKGNSLKKTLVKRRLVREYLEKNHPEYQQLKRGTVAGVFDNWLWSIGCSGYFIAFPLLGALGIIAIYIVFKITVCQGFTFYVVANAILAVVATIVLIWRRYYIMSFVAVVLSIISIYGIIHVGISGIETPAYNMVVDHEGYIFCSPVHAMNCMACSINLLALTSLCMALYPFLKKSAAIIWLLLAGIIIHNDMVYAAHVALNLQNIRMELYVLLCAINADLSVMLGLSYTATFTLLFIYILSLFPIVCALPAFLRAWRACKRQDAKQRANKQYTAMCEKIFYWSMAWLIINMLGAAMAWAHILGIPLEETGVVLAKELGSISKVTGIDYYLLNLVVFCLPVPFSVLVSWIQFTFIKHKIKERND